MGLLQAWREMLDYDKFRLLYHVFTALFFAGAGAIVAVYFLVPEFTDFESGIFHLGNLWFLIAVGVTLLIGIVDLYFLSQYIAIAKLSADGSLPGPIWATWLGILSRPKISADVNRLDTPEAFHAMPDSGPGLRPIQNAKFSGMYLPNQGGSGPGPSGPSKEAPNGDVGLKYIKAYPIDNPLITQDPVAALTGGSTMDDFGGGFGGPPMGGPPMGGMGGMGGPPPPMGGGGGGGRGGRGRSARRGGGGSQSRRGGRARGRSGDDDIAPRRNRSGSGLRGKSKRAVNAYTPPQPRKVGPVTDAAPEPRRRNEDHVIQSESWHPNVIDVDDDGDY